MAASLAGLGCPVTLAGLVGSDQDGGQLRQGLTNKGVERLVLAERTGLATICKTRLLSDSHQQLLRLDRDGDRAAFAAAAEELLERVLPLIAEHRAVVLADYDKGAITPDVARAVIRRLSRTGRSLRGRPQESRPFHLCGRDGAGPERVRGRRALGRPLESVEAIESRRRPSCGSAWASMPC